MTFATTIRRASTALRRWARDFGTGGVSWQNIVASTVAATAAWLIADKVLSSDHASFAPFSTLLIMQSSASKSVTKALRYTGAVVIGLALAALVVTPWHVEPLLFAGMMFLALVIGRWHRLGGQGVEVAVTAVFAYNTFVAASPDTSALRQLPEIALMVALGTTLGVMVNVAVAWCRKHTRNPPPSGAE